MILLGEEKEVGCPPRKAELRALSAASLLLYQARLAAALLGRIPSRARHLSEASRIEAALQGMIFQLFNE